MSEKYPNADTSAERLVVITKHFEDGGTYLELDDPNIHAAFRDLLAMIEERDTQKDWHKMWKEWPKENQRILYSYKYNDRQHSGVEYFSRESYTDGFEIYWRPIPPIPKE